MMADPPRHLVWAAATLDSHRSLRKHRAAFPNSFMSQQYNKVIKRKRRHAYSKRRKERSP